MTKPSLVDLDEFNGYHGQQRGFFIRKARGRRLHAAPTCLATYRWYRPASARLSPFNQGHASATRLILPPSVVAHPIRLLGGTDVIDLTAIHLRDVVGTHHRGGRSSRRLLRAAISKHSRADGAQLLCLVAYGLPSICVATTMRAGGPPAATSGVRITVSLFRECGWVGDQADVPRGGC